MRYVTSTRLLDTSLFYHVLTAIAVAIMLIAFVVVSNMYFIRSIVSPLGEINEVAKKIAAGSYGTVIEKEYMDEIGELKDTINHMSQEISRTERMKNDFLSLVSHELRTPLTAIIGWSETLITLEQMNFYDIKNGLSVIIKETRRLSNMVEELLAFAKMETDRFKLSVSMVNIKNELEETLLLYADSFRQEGIELSYICEEDELLIMGDSERLKQVFFNIMDNTMKYGKDGKACIVTAKKLADSIAITFQDFGGGIHPDDLPFIKEKFYKSKSSKERGSGIGLSVCDEIVELHNGQLVIESEYNKGTTVKIVLPVGNDNGQLTMDN